MCMIKRLLGNWRFGSFKRLTEVFRNIEQERSSLTKRRILVEYLDQTDGIDKIRKLIEYSSRSFANISDRTLWKLLLERGLLSEEQLKQKTRK